MFKIANYFSMKCIMEIFIEKKYNNELSENDGKIFNFLTTYLEKNYKIKKIKDNYIFKSKNNKMIINEKNILNIVKSKNCHTKNNAVMHFVLKSLNNKWSIEKKQHNYVFTKKHLNKTEYLSSDYILRFMETNFS